MGYGLHFFAIIITAMLSTIILYINDTRDIKPPEETVNYNSSDFLLDIDSCHVTNNKLYVAGWAALKNNEEISQIYVTDNSGIVFISQSTRGKDVSDALNLMDKSTVRFYAKSNPKHQVNNKEKVKIIIKSVNGIYYGGEHVCK